MEYIRHGSDGGFPLQIGKCTATLVLQGVTSITLATARIIRFWNRSSRRLHSLSICQVSETPTALENAETIWKRRVKGPPETFPNPRESWSTQGARLHLETVWEQERA